MSKITIEVRKISKIYKLYAQPLDRLKEVFHPLKKKYHKEFYALRDVSFTAGEGDIIGIIGKNGSGKSTLLQIITEVLTPSSGSITVNGSISALLELGAGFNPELTGLENVFFKSSLLGYSAEETKDKLDEILDFADIGDFIHQPVKTYSSGMYVRLAFAVAINVDPDILIVDEALSVGDYRFQKKCLRKIREFKEKGKTILFVSHNTFSVVEFCTKAIWLKDGKVHQVGVPSDVCKDYISFMSYGEESIKKSVKPSCGPIKDKFPYTNDDTAGIKWVDVDDCSFFGTGKAQIVSTCLYSAKTGREIVSFEGGERVVFGVKIEVNDDLHKPIVGFHLCDSKGVFILGLNSYTLGVDIGELKQGDAKVVEFEFDFPYLRNGNYSFSPAIAEGTQAENIQHHWVHDALLVRLISADESANLGHYLVIKENFEIRVQ